MKKFYLLLTLIVITAIQVANAQAPQGIPYQAVARDNAGNLIKNQPISLRFSIHDGSANGAVVYSETHSVTTDALGLFSVNIGGGTSSATLADVNWGSGSKYTQVELDVAGGSNYIDMGTTQMMSVPYALYAGSSAAAPSVFQTTAADPNNISNVNSGNVGIGTDAPTEKLDVVGNAKVSGKLSANGGIANGTNSTALGYGTIANGYASTATGIYTKTYSEATTAMGGETIASASCATAMGQKSNANGVVSTAMGFSTTASGYFTTAMGNRTTSKSFAETSIGTNNTDYTPNSTNSYDAADRLFVIGNGADENNKSDAMIVLKNGNTTINGDVTANSIKIPNGTNTEFLMADGTTSVGPDLTGYATTAALDDLENNVSMNYATNTSLNNLADNVAMNYATNTSLNNLANNVAMNYATNGALATTNTQVQINTTDINNLQTQIGNVQSNFVTTAADANNISNVNSGNVGIGTNTPTAKLDVAGNLKVRGTIIAGEYATANGNSAFSMGRGTTASGDNSTAMGYNTVASGVYSTAMGLFSNASGQGSVSMGANNVASGLTSLALGSDNTASGFFSTAMGIYSNASGNQSVAIGTGITAKSNAEIAVGIYNTVYQPGSTEGYVASDRLFVIGNGTDANNKSDAMVVLKNGNTTIKGTTTANSFVKEGGTSSQYLMADGSTSAGTAATTMGTIGASSTANGGTISSGVLSLAPADGTNGGIVTTGTQTFAGAKTFSSDIIINGINTVNGNLLVNGSASLGGPNTVNGAPSVALGYFNTITGFGGFAFGAGNNSNNNYAFAMGFQNTASGAQSLALGRNNNASGEEAVALGIGNNSTGFASIASGISSSASGEAAIAMGHNTTASGNMAIAMGNRTTSKSYAETSIGLFNTNYTPNSANAYNPTDRLFVIGNGVDENNRGDAMVVLKNGNTTIKGTTTANSFVKAGGTSSQFLMADGSTSTASTIASSIVVPVAMPTIQIGNQLWSKNNLDVSFYRNGDEIPYVDNATTWASLTTGAWCYYNNDPANGEKYGKLYNWYAVNDSRGLAPQGWHIPSDAEWTILSTKLGGNAGGKMKTAGTTNWATPNTGATNSSGFAGLPGGYREPSGTFGALGYTGDLYSSSESNATTAWVRYHNSDNGSLYSGNFNKNFGFSVRCLRD